MDEGRSDEVMWRKKEEEREGEEKEEEDKQEVRMETMGSECEKTGEMR